MANESIKKAFERMWQHTIAKIDEKEAERAAFILSSPNGTKFNITIGDDGVLTATEITE